MSTANELRIQAAKLLAQAKELDGKDQYLVVHHHRFGDTVYTLWTDKLEQEITEDDLIPLLESEYEPEFGESLSYHWIPTNS